MSSRTWTSFGRSSALPPGGSSRANEKVSPPTTRAVARSDLATAQSSHDPQTERAAVDSYFFAAGAGAMLADGLALTIASR